jgi:DNA-binding NarL/FixJ family response regulator
MTTLTPRERQISEYLCKGWENKEIAVKLGISPRTVEDHRMHILKKSKVRNIVELVRAVYGIEEIA